MSTDFWKRKREGLVEVMMKRVAILAVLAFVVPPLVLAAQAENDSAKAYKQKARRLPVEERVRLAMETIQASRDESVLGEAAWDLSLFAFSPEDAGAGLPVVESLIRRTDERTEVYGRANLAKARLLFRLGKKEESVAVFRRALNEQWYRYSYREFQETLRENGENIRAATEEYNVRAGDGLSDEILVFHGIPRDFLDMLAPLLALEVADEEFSAMQEVFPALNESTRRPLARRIGKTICLLADASYDQAIVELEDLEDVAGAGESPRFVYEGSRDIPLYLAAVLFFEGRDYDAAREAFRAYMDRNAEKPPLVLKRALRLMYAMEYRQEDMRKIGELAEFLVRSELMTNEQIRAGLPEGNVASLLNMYRRGLWWQNRLEEAEVVAFQIMDEYYPHTLASGDAVMNLAAYMFLLHDDIDAAERLLDDLIQDPPCDGILPFALVSRAGLAKERGEHQKALWLVREALNRMPDSPQGSLRRCKEGALRIRDQCEASLAASERTR